VSSRARTGPESRTFGIELSASLPVRPDAERVRRILGEAFVAHIHDLWPVGRDQGSPEWIADHVDEVLATIERLYAIALGGKHPGSAEFLDRMAWLPTLAHDIEQGAARLDAF
jgi:hypothetical protein